MTIDNCIRCKVQAKGNIFDYKDMYGDVWYSMFFCNECLLSEYRSLYYNKLIEGFILKMALFMTMFLVAITPLHIAIKLMYGIFVLCITFFVNMADEVERKIKNIEKDLSESE